MIKPLKFALIACLATAKFAFCASNDITNTQIFSQRNRNQTAYFSRFRNPQEYINYAKLHLPRLREIYTDPRENHNLKQILVLNLTCLYKKEFSINLVDIVCEYLAPLSFLVVPHRHAILPFYGSSFLAEKAIFYRFLCGSDGYIHDDSQTLCADREHLYIYKTREYDDQSFNNFVKTLPYNMRLNAQFLFPPLNSWTSTLTIVGCSGVERVHTFPCYKTKEDLNPQEGQEAQELIKERKESLKVAYYFKEGYLYLRIQRMLQKTHVINRKNVVGDVRKNGPHILIVLNTKTQQIVENPLFLPICLNDGLEQYEEDKKTRLSFLIRHKENLAKNALERSGYNPRSVTNMSFDFDGRIDDNPSKVRLKFSGQGWKEALTELLENKIKAWGLEDSFRVLMDNSNPNARLEFIGLITLSDIDRKTVENYFEKVWGNHLRLVKHFSRWLTIEELDKLEE